MTMQHLSVEEFNDRIRSWAGKKIKISKEEVADHDEAILSIKSISYETNTRRIDDYQPMHTLHLNGTGEVETTKQTYEELPLSSYEIPLEDSTLYQYNEEKFRLITDRGTYTIELV
ncbi:hypothetical protein J2T56_000611 [Natronobacillus azotifigens]|uniref:Uncharacterized protein n=1 Tax=Natronobacillus azotifigens TaxID=472978 RepID=A0A9J6RBE4_9BACI|nr:hypothetical protein [Natronobacillus azotifigens]MCZ0702644.1 hypothetical protein [Natronobacillus azotifigens]